MKKTLLLFALVFSTMMGYAQISHDLEIYSEDGLKFTLFCNGRQMNEAPVSNVQIINTDKDYLQVKIVFEDASIPVLEKKILQIADPTPDKDQPVTTVYKVILKKDKYKLKFASRSDKKIQEQVITQEQIVIQNQNSVGRKIVISW